MRTRRRLLATVLFLVLASAAAGAWLARPRPAPVRLEDDAGLHDMAATRRAFQLLRERRTFRRRPLAQAASNDRLEATVERLAAGIDRGLKELEALAAMMDRHPEAAARARACAWWLVPVECPDLGESRDMLGRWLRETEPVEATAADLEALAARVEAGIRAVVAAAEERIRREGG
ncbi:MAG: hypothetical protein M9894_21065 [Planctomycetes bacterium]|nr:hypothetical protein [Planctomycetota bacterium]